MKSININYNPRIDALRFLAASLVITYHSVTWYASSTYYNPIHFERLIFIEGHSGVTLFLVMSGFLMHQIFKKYPGITYNKFIYNRFVRIFPLATIFFIATISLNQTKVSASDQLINYATLMFSFDRNSQIAPVWTVAIEFQFYLLVPVIIAFINKNGFGGLLKFSIMLLILRSLVILKAKQDGLFSYDVSYYSILGRIDQFLIGMYISEYSIKNNTKFSSPFHLLAALTIILFVFYLSASTDWWNNNILHSLWKALYLTVDGIVFGYLFISVIQCSLKFRCESLLARLGATSYSMYLWHELLVRALHNFAGEYSTNNLEVFAVFVSLPVVVIVSWFSYEWIEKPFLKFREHY